MRESPDTDNPPSQWLDAGDDSLEHRIVRARASPVTGLMRLIGSLLVRRILSGGAENAAQFDYPQGAALQRQRDNPTMSIIPKPPS